jgi:hypothetical protein
MAQFGVNIPDEEVDRVLDAFAERYGWDPEGDQTKQQFAKHQVILFIKDTVKAHEAEVIGRAALDELADQQAANADDVDQNLAIT